jgi:excisionase family DNA binding protein
MHPPEPLALGIAEVVSRSGLSRSLIYEALKRGELKSLRIGSRRLVMLDDLRCWLESHRVGEAA